jgi:uncharacterized protein involved in tolerance to divalent cations
MAGRDPRPARSPSCGPHAHELVPRIVERLDAEHPYEVPGVFALPIVATSPGYRAWMLAQTDEA